MKAINWPAAFRTEVMEEDTQTIRAAFRIGRLYYDNRYWVADETVYIRVNHKIIRTGVIVGDLKCCRVQDLAESDYKAQKQTLQTMDRVIQFLSETYGQPVTPETVVTVVYYQNLPLDPEMMEVEDDPHMG